MLYAHEKRKIDLLVSAINPQSKVAKNKDLSVTRVMLKRFSVVKNFKIESSNSKQWDKQTEHLARIRRSTCSTCTS